MWPGLEPGARGEYDDSYLDAIQTIVDSCAAHDIYVILDVHQDLFHRGFCGEGVPDYVYQTCLNAEPRRERGSFPAPVVNETYPLDQNGYPELASCLSKSFFSYYLTREVSSAFQCLYDDVDNLWAALGDAWAHIAKRFKNSKNVLGYELLNEPWMGDIYKSPELMLPKRTEEQFLQPMYASLHSAIREVDDEKIIFFEGITIDYWQSGFTQGPGGTSYNDRQAISYHIYCVADPTKVEALLCSGVDQEFFSMRRKDGERLGLPIIMTEFGATQDLKGAIFSLKDVLKQADKHQQSWCYWQYKYYEDLTTCTPSGESLFNNDGSVNKDKLLALSRTYPSAVAGMTKDWSFSTETGRFDFSYTTLPAASASSASSARVTEIRFNAELYYPHGMHVELSGADASLIQVQCPVTTASSTENNYLSLAQKVGDADGGQEVVVVVSPCTREQQQQQDVCTCPFPVK